MNVVPCSWKFQEGKCLIIAKLGVNVVDCRVLLYLGHVTNHPPLTQPSSINPENLFAALHPAMTHKWNEFGESLGINEDLIDEIYTNSETDEECLKEILDVWIKKSSPTWKEVADSLKSIGEKKLAESLYIKRKLHYSVFVLSL